METSIDSLIIQYRLLSEKKSKISIKNADLAVELLNDIFKQSKNMKLLCRLVCESTHIISYKFTEKYASKFTKKQFNDYCLYVTENIQSISKSSIIPICFSIVAIKKEKSSLDLLKQVVLIVTSKNTISQQNCKYFKTHLTEKDQGEIFLADFSNWSQDELKLFDKYIKDTFQNIDELPYANKIKNWVERYIPDEIEKLNNIIKDLENRLEQVKIFDNTLQNQEIKKLKVDIAKALKLEYDDFLQNVNEPLSQNNYDFFKATTKQIFKVLKRYGIKF